MFYDEMLNEKRKRMSIARAHIQNGLDCVCVMCLYVLHSNWPGFAMSFSCDSSSSSSNKKKRKKKIG